MKTFLAPMAGYTDRIFRDICRDLQADVVFTEMANCHLFSIYPEKAWELLGVKGEKRPLAVQLFGNDPVLLARAAAMLDEGGVEYIDLNAGCPARKVTATGSGSSLMRNTELFAAIIRSMRAAVRNASFSVKIRSGWDEHSLNYIDVGRIAQEEGVDFVTLHARTRAQGFSGAARWEHIASLKDSLDIPVVGNGDLRSLEDVKRMIEQTRVDGVMVGRGALSRPQIFREVRINERIELSAGDYRDMIIRLYEGKARMFGERRGVLEMRKIVPFIVKGWPNAREIRMAANRADNMASVMEIFA